LVDFHRELEAKCLGHGHEGRETGIAAGRQGVIQALSLDSRSFGNLCDATFGIGNTTQSHQENLRPVRIFQRGLEILTKDCNL
jgi:hypothetical protein